MDSMTPNRRSPLPRIATGILAAALAAGSFVEVDAHAKPKVSLAQARAAALAAVPGKILEEELEREHGRRVYSFEIAPSGAPAGTIKEVHIDAKDGTVVAIEDEHEHEHDVDDDD